MSEWQPIETAPHGKRVDLWCYQFRLKDAASGETERFSRRFADAFFKEAMNPNAMMVITSAGPNQNQQQAQQMIDYGGGWRSSELTQSHTWTATHWMPIPEGPK